LDEEYVEALDRATMVQTFDDHCTGAWRRKIPAPDCYDGGSIIYGVSDEVVAVVAYKAVGARFRAPLVLVITFRFAVGFV
jgi:hypothetical protein